ncbi:unnamed protein product [Adineta steineri]|uniref:Uncharacterized protein n=1 Tax=Adineta steineri TaxID=433720 RepID=A0A815GUW8_9BILA|nr:unnamed protein product [Adineta steineri]
MDWKFILASSNKEPHHEWCSIEYCGYLRSLEKNEEYDHNQHRLPLGVMKAIRPVFDETPKYRYATGIVIDLCAAMAVLCYNDGSQAIIPVITGITGGGGGGYYTRVAMRRLDESCVYAEHKKKTKQTT